MTTYTTTYASPIGDLLLVGDGEALASLSTDAVPPAGAVTDAKAFTLARRELDAYFAGELKRFTVPLLARGTTFQEKVWTQLSKVPFGRTASYKEIAAKIRHPDAVRAVGNANGRNPILLVVPCHRIVAADGSLGGYSSGLWRKRWLLEHEGAEVKA